jgi:site-specific recombinase XerD
MIHARSEAESDLVQAISGIAYFYRQFGYEYALELEDRRATPLVLIPKAQEDEPEHYALREATARDIPVMEELYKRLVEQHASFCFAAIFALGYWAGLRISEIAALRLDQCHINQRAGSITLLDAKGGKTRTLDLHNLARRALYDYLFPEHPQDRERDEESAYVFTSQRAAWLRQQGRPDHLSERGIEHQASILVFEHLGHFKPIKGTYTRIRGGSSM